MPDKPRLSLSALAFGARASPVETGSALAFGCVGIVIAIVCALWAEAEFEWWQWLILAFVAFDLVGGVAANATVASTFQYHRPDEPLRPLVFASGHVHPFALALVIPSLGWDLALALYLGALLGTSGVIIADPAIKRAFGLGYCAVALSSLQLIDIPVELAWFAPAFLLKLVAGHAVPMWAVAPPPQR